jgi:hypothetical protein
MTKTNRQKSQYATDMAAMWLHRANVASEKGQTEKAERLYEKSQKWHDKMNEYLGNASYDDLASSGGIVNAP